jgi:hypothetical protein
MQRESVIFDRPINQVIPFFTNHQESDLIHSLSPFRPWTHTLMWRIQDRFQDLLDLLFGIAPLIKPYVTGCNQGSNPKARV